VFPLSLSFMRIEIDAHSGFCFGVERAVKRAEEALIRPGELYCLGDIVHNHEETNRLKTKGLKEASTQNLSTLSGKRMLIRAHGEPPETYRAIRESDIELIDATCPVVLKLQKRVKKAFEEKPGAQIVIFGKPGHPEVTGLSGQAEHKAIVVNGEHSGLDKIDFSKPIILFSQTTQSLECFHELKILIEGRISELSLNPDQLLTVNDTICRQVSRRGPALKKFAESHDVIIFVSGPDSSNGRYLFGLIKNVNPRSYWVSSQSQLKREWFEGAQSTGISGATSTPRWQLEKMAEAIKNL